MASYSWSIPNHPYAEWYVTPEQKLKTQVWISQAWQPFHPRLGHRLQSTGIHWITSPSKPELKGKKIWNPSLVLKVSASFFTITDRPFSLNLLLALLTDWNSSLLWLTSVLTLFIYKYNRPWCQTTTCAKQIVTGMLLSKNCPVKNLATMKFPKMTLLFSLVERD